MKTIKVPANFFGDQYWQRLELLGKSYTKRQSVWLRAKKDLDSFERIPSVAIVGTRRPTSYGLRFVSDFTKQLANSNLPPRIISGGALGIDAWAHECALREGLVTESWVVGPIKNPNPRSHASLFAAIVERGGAIFCPDSLEPGPGEAPFRSDWVCRNAYLVARADVVVVPEANERSGTWSSVRWANRMGIPVFALPGPVDRSSSAGTNLMISSGYAHPAGGATKLMADLVVEGIVGPYNKNRDEPLGLAELERLLCQDCGLQVTDLPGLAAHLGLKLEELCEYLLSEIRLASFAELVMVLKGEASV